MVSLGLAMLSWRLVEEPALRLKNWTPAMLREPEDQPTSRDDGGPTDDGAPGSVIVPADRFHSPGIDRESALASTAG
ncbi:hypothetical protein ACQP08_06005 [Micromonospora zamorensis]|uniref:hypothetical protein n=1 Tax=Micromonospora zamorensis TaxID=709883 RepID=UPI003D8CEBDE